MEREPSGRSLAYATARVLSGVLAVPIITYALLIVANQVRTGFDPIGASLALVSGTVGALGAWFTLRGHLAESRRRMRFALGGGMILGGAAFIAGFFGPIIFLPGANQGPLLGIFVTGPLGFVAGVLIGWIVALRRRPRAERELGAPA